MTPVDDTRVQQARRRLRQVSDERSRHDAAVRILTLVSPRVSDAPLRLHSGFSIISGLSEDGRQALASTVAAIYDQTPSVGLDGTVLFDGEHHGLHAPRPAVAIQSAGAEAMFGAPQATPALPDIGWADAGDLKALVEAIDSAVRLTEAELRGADEYARSLRLENTDVPEVIDLRMHDGDRAEIRETLSAMDAMAPNPAHVADLRTSRSRNDPDGVAGILQQLNIDPGTNPFETADRVLAESDELAAIRLRLEGRLVGVTRSRPTNPASAELTNVDNRRIRLRRRLRSQRGFLAAAQDHLSLTLHPESTGASRTEAVAIPANSDGRPLPLLLEDPFQDIPGRQAIAALSVLLRVSELCQVICVSDGPELANWADAVGDRADWMRASGWFEGEAAC